MLTSDGRRGSAQRVIWGNCLLYCLNRMYRWVIRPCSALLWRVLNSRWQNGALLVFYLQCFIFSALYGVGFWEDGFSFGIVYSLAVISLHAWSRAWITTTETYTSWSCQVLEWSGKNNHNKYSDIKCNYAQFGNTISWHLLTSMY